MGHEIEVNHGTWESGNSWDMGMLLNHGTWEGGKLWDME